MGTIAAGKTSSISLLAGQAINTTGTGVAVLGPGPWIGQQIPLQGTWRVGPFAFDVAVGITATTSISYTVDINPTDGDVLVTEAELVAIRRAGNLRAGADYATDTGLRYRATTASQFIPLDGAPILAYNTVGLGGDSIFANGWFNGQPNSMSIVNWAGTQLPNQFEQTTNVGVGGQAIATVTSTQIATLAADSCELVWLHEGVNNLRSGNATATSIEQAALDLKAQLDILTPVKQGVIVDAVTPRVFGAGDGYRSIEIPQLNEAMARVCKAYPNVIFNDVYASILDTSSTIGDPDTTTLFDTQIHPNSKGAALIGIASARNLRNHLRMVDFYQSTARLTSPDMSGTGGTTTAGTGSVTGSAPTGINVAVISGGSAVTLATKAYTSTKSAINVAITNAGAAGYVEIKLAVNTSLNSQLVAGDKVQLTCKYRVKSGNNILRFSASLQINGTINISTMLSNAILETPNILALTSKGYSATVKTPVYTMPAGFTTFTPVISIQVGATTGAIDFDLIDFVIDKVAAP